MALLLLLLSCAGDAERYHQAATAPTLSSALDACAGISEADVRGECQIMARGRFDDVSSCEAVEEGLWRDECVFLNAEHLAQEGDYAAAFSLCVGISLARVCDDHVVNILATQMAERPFSEVASIWEANRDQVVDHFAELQLWRTWYHERIARDLPLDIASCTSPGCSRAVRMEIRDAVAAGVEANGCPLPMPSWATSPRTQQLFSILLSQRCAAPPPGNGEPGIAGL